MSLPLEFATSPESGFVSTLVLCLGVFVYSSPTGHPEILRSVDVGSEVVKEATNAALLQFNQQSNNVYLFSLVKIVKADRIINVFCTCHVIEFNVVENKNCPKNKGLKCDKQPTDDVPVKRIYAKVTGRQGYNMTVEAVREL